MKVITVKQPYASLIAYGYKELEFRTWKTKYRGEIFIHAGLGIDKKAMEKYKSLNIKYPQGCIIAKADLTDCIYIDEKMKKELYKKNPLIYSGSILNKDWNGYGFKLENIKKSQNKNIDTPDGLFCEEKLR